MKAIAWLTRDRLALLLGLFAPLVLCVVLVPFRHSLENTHAALLLVVVIVGVAALGNRLAGWLAALSAGVWFDFFLTEPHEHFTITSRDDVETTVLLLVVGAAVTELAVWARHEQSRAVRQASYVEGVHRASEVAVTGTSPTQLIDRVAGQLITLLGLRGCRFHYGTGIGNPRLEHDGGLMWGASRWDVDSEGFPDGRETELLVSSGGRFWGRFLMTPTSGARPDLTQRLAAIAMADQVGAALSEYRAEQD
ncbi:DUF4118 domain-containing protein [Jatrophihabitans sp. DSM 45814]